MADLTREDWLRAARLALLNGGPEAVRVEKLAFDLHVTKGSFYWHFKSRGELLEALIREWEEEKSLLVVALARADRRSGLRFFFDELQRRTTASERGEWPSDAAIFAWASVSPEIAQRARMEERRRIALLRQLAAAPELADYVYMAYLGFLMRRRRVPEAAAEFATLRDLSIELLSGAPRRSRRAPQPAAGTRRRRAKSS